MTCHEARDAFSDLYDNALSGAPLVTITQHLASCPDCRAEWAAFRRAMQAVSDLGGAEPSPGFAFRVRQRAEAPSWWRRTVQSLFLPLHVKLPIQALALVLVAFAGLLLYQRSPDLRRAAEPQPAAPPPAAREVPVPAAPPATGEAAPREEGAGPMAAAPKAEKAEPPADATAPVPQARVEAETDRASSALRDEAKELGKTATPSETPKAAEPPQDFRAKSPESGVAAQRLQQAAPAPQQLPAPSPAPAPATEGRISSIPTKSADELYSTTLTDIGSQRYDQAIDGLRAFIAQNPRDARIPDARLHLADAYVAQRHYTEAIAEYAALAREFPDSPLIPTALYRQAQALLAAGDQAGCRMLQDVADRYPQSPEAALARETLSTRCR